eukprot:11002455-Alexandrium_andersonii.AAC.2
MATRTSPELLCSSLHTAFRAESALSVGMATNARAELQATRCVERSALADTMVMASPELPSGFTPYRLQGWA